MYPSTAQPVENPTDKYPKPPYKFVRQPWPGLASKMDPPPDHGAMQALGGLNFIVSNAGRQQEFPQITDMPDEEFDWIIKTNIYAAFYIFKTALPYQKPGATIIATTSEQAYEPDADLYAYAQTKAATMNFVKSLAKALGPKGIRVNGVTPEPVYTLLQVSGGASEEHFTNFGGKYPLGRGSGKGQP